MSKCPNCGVENDSGMKFCNECGTSLPQMKACPSCQTQWPMSTKFCQECGYNFAGESGGSGGSFIGDKNVIAGDVNSTVHNTSNVVNNNTSNTNVNNNTSNVKNTNISNNSTTNVNKTLNNVNTVTDNRQITNNYIKQEVREETELDKEAKRMQIEKLRLEKMMHEQELLKTAMANKLELEKQQRESEVERERAKIQLAEMRENIPSPYSKKVFRCLGIFGGFLGIQYAYIRRWGLFAITLLCMIVMIGASEEKKEAEAELASLDSTVQIESVRQRLPQSGSDEVPMMDGEEIPEEDPGPVEVVFGLALTILWFGGTFFITKDSKGRKLT